MTVKSIIEVAVAVICHKDNYLLARRHEFLHQGGKLEFVGGKFEQGESGTQALVREVAEELRLDISQEIISPMGKIEHDYGDKAVRLWVFLVQLSAQSYQNFAKVKLGADNQQLFWYDKATLLTLRDELPKANGEILTWLQNSN